MGFERGQSGNPMGRPKGSYGGRIQALAALDRMLGKKRNQNRLVKALEDEFLKDPVRFFKTVIMPLLPRESKLSFDREGVIQWKSLIGAGAPVGSEQLEVNSEQLEVDGDTREAILVVATDGAEGEACQ